MAIVVDATVGGENSNSYISLEDAETYFDSRMPLAPNWDAEESNDNKNRALVTATRIIEQIVEWDGEVVSDTQALSWPLQDMVDSKGIEIGTDEIPAEVGYAVCELAETLLETDRTADLASQGVDAIAAGDLNIKFQTNTPPARKVLPDYCWELISRWAKRRTDYNKGSAKLVRG